MHFTGMRDCKAHFVAGAGIALALAAPAGWPATVDAATCAGSSTGLIAIPDLGTGTYQGQQGGLYPGGTNTPPAAYAAAGVEAAQAIIARDLQGHPDPNGKIVLLSMGMSNTLIEFSAFLGNERNDSGRDPVVLLVNGAQGGQDASRWVDPNAPVWSYVESQLQKAGVTDAQVEAVWLKQAQASPTSDFDTYRQSLESQMAAIVRDAAARFPNLQQVFVSPRTYAGYATTRLNPEPYAYQTGFADKLLVAQSVAQPKIRPWIGWGPYVWTDGTRGRSDGFTWMCADARASDGTHPSDQGAAKVAQQLQQFFGASQFSPWFRVGGQAAVASPATPESQAARVLSWAWLGVLVLAAALLAMAVLARRRMTRAAQAGAAIKSPSPPVPGG